MGHRCAPGALLGALLGCTTSWQGSATAAEDFKCSEGTLSSWSVAKTLWCCSNKGLGCQKMPSQRRAMRVPVACLEGSMRTSDAEYCCHQFGHGCEEKSKAASFNCSDGASKAIENWSVRKLQWCCAKGAEQKGDEDLWGCAWLSDSSKAAKLLASTPTTARPAAVEGPERKFNCAAVTPESSVHEQAWCCANLGLGCPKITTPSPATPPPTPPRTEPRDVSVPDVDTPSKATDGASSEGCMATCELPDSTGTCSARIKWAAKHQFQEQDDPCRWAHALVKQQCGSCFFCSLEHADCASTGVGAPPPSPPSPPETPGIFMVVPSPPPPITTSRVLLPGNAMHEDGPYHSKVSATGGGGSSWRDSSEAAARGSSLNNEARHRSAVSSEAKQRRAISSEAYDCTVGQATWELGWSPLKKAWCCTHQDLGCTVGSGHSGEESHEHHVHHHEGVSSTYVKSEVHKEEIVIFHTAGTLLSTLGLTVAWAIGISGVSLVVWKGVMLVRAAKVSTQGTNLQVRNFRMLIEVD